MEINAAEFRTRCFQLLDEVNATHKEIIITKRGRPIARLTHIRKKDEKDPFLGALAGWGKTIGDVTIPIAEPEDWDLD